MKTVMIFTALSLLFTNAWAKKTRASKEDIAAFVAESLQYGIDEVTNNGSSFTQKYVLEGEVSISHSVGINIISTLIEPISDAGQFDNDHGPDIFHVVKFIARDREDSCHMCRLHVIERRKGPESTLYKYAKEHVEKHEKIILLDDEGISKLTFENPWDGSMRWFFNRTIVDKENIPCLEKDPTINQGSRGNNKSESIPGHPNETQNVNSN